MMVVCSVIMMIDTVGSMIGWHVVRNDNRLIVISMKEASRPEGGELTMDGIVKTLLFVIGTALKVVSSAKRS